MKSLKNESRRRLRSRWDEKVFSSASVLGGGEGERGGEKPPKWVRNHTALTNLTKAVC